MIGTINDVFWSPLDHQFRGNITHRLKSRFPSNINISYRLEGRSISNSIIIHRLQIYTSNSTIDNPAIT